MNPRISVIIITYNRVQLLVETLQQLLSDPYQPKEIIVIDNHSTDDTGQILTRQFGDRILYKRMERNLGVPGGRNEGVKLATGDILFFIDDDAVLMPNGLEKVARKFQDNPRLGIFSAKVINFYTGQLDHSSWVYSIHRLKDQNIPFRSYKFVGGASAISRAVFDQCGYFWDRLFFMHEEIDLSLRALDKGFEIWYYPDVVVYHKLNSTGRMGISSRFFEYGTGNMVWIHFRYYPVWLALLRNLYFLFFNFLSAMRSGNVPAYGRGLRRCVAGITLPFKERWKISWQTIREVQQLKKVRKDSVFKRAKRVLGIEKFNYENI